MNIRVFAVLFALCVLQATAFLGFGAKQTGCDEDAKCSLFCHAKALNISTDSGEIVAGKIPFRETLKRFDIERCLANNRTGGCEKFNAFRNCARNSAESVSKAFLKACAEELKTEEVGLTAASLLKVFLKPSTVKCTIRCMAVKFNAVNSDNTLKLGEFEKVMREKGYAVGDIVDKARKCEQKEAKTHDDCLKIANIVQCVLSEFSMSNLNQLKNLFRD